MKTKRTKRTKKHDGPWAFVATPAYDGKVETGYCQSIVEAAYASPLMGIRVTLSCLANGAFIDLARNQFAKVFLEDHPECTHLFFIDADLDFPPDAFCGLIGLNLPVVAGVYPKREPDESYPIRYHESPTGGLWVEDEFIMAERVPTGFLCIRRDVVEEMAKDAIKLKIAGTEGEVARLFYTEVRENADGSKSMIGEDYAWCDDYVKKYKKPIHVWPDIDFVHGQYKGNLAEYLNRTLSGPEVVGHVDDSSAA